MKENIFQHLYDSYHHDIFQFLMYLVKDRLVAEDLSQEVYIRVLRSYENFKGKSTEKTWLFTIAKNVAIDYFRKNNIRKKHRFDTFDWESERLIAPQVPLDASIILNDDLKQLLEALEYCTGDQKMVIVLRFFQEMSIHDTAKVLNWSEGKVKVTQNRAIKALREIMLKKEAIQIEI